MYTAQKIAFSVALKHIQSKEKQGEKTVKAVIIIR